LYLSGFRNVRRVWGTRLNSTAERRSMASLGTLMRGLATGMWEFYARSAARGARPTMYCSLRVFSSWRAVAIANLSISSDPTEISERV